MDFFQDVPFSWIIEILRCLTPSLWIIPLVTARFKRDSQIDGLRSQGAEIDFSHLICQYLMGLVSGEQVKKRMWNKMHVHYHSPLFSKILYSPTDAFSLSVESVSGLDLFWQVAKDTVDGRSPVKHQIEQYKLNSHLGGFTYLFMFSPKKWRNWSNLTSMLFGLKPPTNIAISVSTGFWWQNHQQYYWILDLSNYSCWFAWDFEKT